MPSAKKNNKTLNHREKKIFNYWIGLVLIGPAIFFLFYFFSGNSASETPGQKTALPEKQLQAGEPAAVDNMKITAAPEGRVTLSEQLTMGNNRIIAEGGHLFMVVPLEVPEKFGDPSPSNWYVTNPEGSRYELLRVVSKNPAGPDAAVKIEQGSRLVYLIFKVKKGQSDHFLVYMAPGGQAAWKMPAPNQ
ncbi:MAG: hypothetical protein ACOY4I_15110 [Bacillota bacterium]